MPPLQSQTQARPTVDLHRVEQVPDVDREISQIRSAYGQRSRDKPGGLPHRQAPSAGDAVLRDAVHHACSACGRPGDATRVLAYLEDEWLQGSASIAGLTEAGWRELRLPIGLKEELKRALQLAPPPGPFHAAAGAPNPYGTGPAGSINVGAPRYGAGGRRESRESQDSEDSRDSREHAHPRRESGPRAKLQAASMGDHSSAYQGTDKEKEVVERLRAFVKKRGCNTLRGVGQRFRIMDRDQSRGVTEREFREALQRGLGDFQVTEEEVKLLWKRLDENGNGVVDFEEFVALVNGGLNPRRKHAVDLCFSYLDRNGNGALELDDLKMRYDPSPLSEASPHLLLGPKPPDQLLIKFLGNMQRAIGGSTSGVISAVEFEKYYDRISAGIDSDMYFETMLEKAWKLPPDWVHAGPRGPMPTVGMPRAGDPLPESGEGLITRIRSALKKVPIYDERIVEAYKPKRQFRVGGKAVQAAMRIQQAGQERGARKDSGAKDSAGSVRFQSGAASQGGERGAGAPQMDWEQFQDVLRKLRPETNERELRMLRVIFSDGADGVDYAAFMKYLQGGPKSGHRFAAIKGVFDELAGGSDKDSLELESLQQASPAFKKAFEGQSGVSRAEWHEFHDVAGSGVTDDAAFERALRQAWGLHVTRGASGPGSEGVRAFGGQQPSGGYYKGMSRLRLG